MATNPILNEINGLSPGAKTALLNAHQANSVQTQPSSVNALIPPVSAPPAPKLQAPSQIPVTPKMGVAPTSAPPVSVSNGPAPSLGAPSQPPTAPIVPNRGGIFGTQPRMIGEHQEQQLPEAALSSPAMPANITPPGKSGMPLLPPPTMANVRLDPISAERAEQQRKIDAGSGISQIHSKIENSSFGQNHPFLGKLAGWGAQIPAMAADIGVSAVAPAITANTPGTEYHHLRDLRLGQTQLAQDTANEEKQAEAGNQTAQAGEHTEIATGRELENANAPQKFADTHAQSEATIGNLQSETRDRDATAALGPSLAVAYSHRVNEVLKTGADPSQDPIVQRLADAITSIQKQRAAPTMHAVTLSVPGKGRVAGKTDGQGNLLLENNQPAPAGSTIFQQPSFAAIYPQITSGRATDETTAKWQQESGAYQGTLNTLGQAKTGSELSASLVPLGLALITPTAAGVHRINTAEIAQAGSGIGSLARRLDAALENAGSGALPPDTIREAEQFVKMYQALKYRQYLAEVKRTDDTFGTPVNQRFVTSMDGQQEMSLADAMKQAGATGNEPGPLGASSEVYASDGKTLIGHVVNGKYVALGGK